MKKHLPVTIGVAALALVATSGTTAVAASLVTGKQIKNGSITTADVRDGSLTSVDVRDATLTGADLRDATVAGADIADGSVTGADVRNGALGGADLADGSVTAADLAPGVVPDAPALRARQAVKFVQVAPDEVKLLNVDCAAGEIATGGGGNAYATPGMNIVQTSPVPAGIGAPSGWQVTYHNTTGTAHDIYGYAVCVKLG